MSKRRKKILLRIAALVFGVLLALAVAEVIVRIGFPYVKDYVVPRGTAVMDRQLGWKLQPGNEATHHSQYFDVQYRINASGMRDRPRDKQQKEGVYRILLYGDSQIFGWGVPREARISDLLEEEDSGLEVWNFGVLAYGLDQSLLQYEQTEPVPAQEVVFFISGATTYRATVDFAYGKPKPKFELDAGGRLQLHPVVPSSARLWSGIYDAMSPFYLPYFVEYQLKRLSNPAPPRDPNYARRKPTHVTALTRALLARAAALADSRGHDFSIISRLQGPDAELLSKFCSENDIPLLRIDIDVERSRLGVHDRHWNTSAHRAIAGQLRSWLENRGIRPEIPK